MEKATGKIGLREYVAIILLVVGVKLSDDTPALFVEHLGTAYWLAPFIIGMISFIPIYLSIKIISIYKDKNLHDCILHLFGKFIGHLISISLLLLGVSSLIVDSGIYVDIIGTMYFSKTPTLIIYSILMTVCAYMAKRGLENIGTVAWLVIFYIKIALLVSLLFSFMRGNISFLHPILGFGGWNLLKESYAHVSIYADFLYLGLIAPYIVSAKAFKKGTLIAFIIVTIELSFSFLVFLIVFDYKGLPMLNYPYHELIRLLQIGFLTNVETFFFPIWILATFVRFSFYLYLIAVFIGGIFNIKNFEHLIPTIATIVLIIGMAPDAPTFTLVALRETLLNIISPLFLTFPILMWIMAKLRGDLKNEKAKQNV